MLATQDVVDLALNSRRLIEIMNLHRYAKQISINSIELRPKGLSAEVIKESVALYDLLSRILHSKTCLACRNILSVVGHFDIRSIPKSLLKGEMATRPTLIVESDKARKRICDLEDFSGATYGIIEHLASKDKDLTKYLKTRHY
jgi:hypothetical protein